MSVRIFLWATVHEQIFMNYYNIICLCSIFLYLRVRCGLIINEYKYEISTNGRALMSNNLLRYYLK